MSAGAQQGDQPPAPAPPAQAMPQAPAPVQDAASLSKETLEAQMRWAIYQGAVLAAGATTPEELAQCGDGILRISQAVVILDPELVSPGGVPPDALSPPRPDLPESKTTPSGRDAIKTGLAE